VREACRRVLGVPRFYVLVIGGMVLNVGLIDEMKSGVGKTLVATLPLVSQRPRQPWRARGDLHQVRLNDYLARCDTEWMG